MYFCLFSFLSLCLEEWETLPLGIDLSMVCSLQVVDILLENSSAGYLICEGVRMYVFNWYGSEHKHEEVQYIA